MADEPLSQEEAERVRRFRETLLYQCGPDLDVWDLVETDKRYLNPGGYYFCLANEYLDNVPDPGGKGPPWAIRSQIFFSRRDYDPWALQALADLPHPRTWGCS